MNLSETIAQFITDTESVPEPVQDMVGHAVLDLMTAAVAGFSTKGAQSARTAACAMWGNGNAQCWFSDAKLPVAGAAFVNASAASMLDIDDGHRAAAGHPGASIIPAVFAEVGVRDIPTQKLMTAIALGYEVAVRASAARDLSKVDTLVSGKWCAQGVVAAVGWLRGMDAPRMAQALSIAATTAPNLHPVAYTSDMGNHVKEGIPWATVTGFAALDLAAAGSTGPIDFWDHPEEINSSKLVGGLGESWMIESVYFKPYSCCRWAHAAIDGLVDLLGHGLFEIKDITGIRVQTFSRALQLNNKFDPPNIEAAQYSVPYCMALAAIRGPAALLPLKEASLHDPEVVALASKIELRVDREMDAMFSEYVPANVEVRTGKGPVSRRVDSPKGEPDNPMSREDLSEKFLQVTEGYLTDSRAKELLLSAFAFRDGRPASLLSQLSTPFQNAVVEQATKVYTEDDLVRAPLEQLQ